MECLSNIPTELFQREDLFVPNNKEFFFVWVEFLGQKWPLCCEGRVFHVMDDLLEFALGFSRFFHAAIEAIPACYRGSACCC